MFGDTASRDTDTIGAGREVRLNLRMRGAAERLLPRRCFDRADLPLLALALLAAGFVLLRAYLNGGAGLHSMSVAYIGLGNNLLAGNGLSDVLTAPDGGLEPFVVWPPLYSFALAAFSLGVFDLYDVAAPLNAAILALTIFAVGRYLRRQLQSRSVFYTMMLVTAASLPLLWIASFAMVETLFVLLTTLALIQGHKFLDEGQTSALIWAAVFAALACQTRYIGVAVPVTIGILLLLQREETLRHRARRLAAFSLIVALPMALWAVHYLSAVDLGRRQDPTDYSLPDLLDNLGAAFAAGYERILLLPFIELIPAAVWVAIAVLLMGLAGILAGILWQARRGAAWPRRPIAVFGGFALVYLAMIIAASFAGITWDGFMVRFFVPLWIPALIVAALVLDAMLGMIDTGRISGAVRPNAARITTTALTAILCLSAAAMLLATVLDTRQVKTDTIGSVSAMGDFDIIQHLQANPGYDGIYSNAPYVIYHHTGGKIQCRLIPTVYFVGGYGVDNVGAGIVGREQLRRWIADLPAGVHIAWLYQPYIGSASGYAVVDVLRAMPELAVAQDLADGAIFRVQER